MQPQIAHVQIETLKKKLNNTMSEEERDTVTEALDEWTGIAAELSAKHKDVFDMVHSSRTETSRSGSRCPSHRARIRGERKKYDRARETCCTIIIGRNPHELSRDGYCV